MTKSAKWRAEREACRAREREEIYKHALRATALSSAVVSVAEKVSYDLDVLRCLRVKGAARHHSRTARILRELDATALWTRTIARGARSS